MGDVSPQILNFNRLLLGLVPKLETSENLQIKNLSPQVLSSQGCAQADPNGETSKLRI